MVDDSTIEDLSKQKVVLLFDGHCNLCNHSVNYFIKKDRKNKLLFGALQSQQAQSFLQKKNLETQDFSSLVVVKSSRVYRRSRAVLEVFKVLPYAWKILYVFIIIPPFIRNFIYHIIAKNRYKWFGKKTTCRLATPEEKLKFIS